jgi:hypothetical protein
MEFNEKEAFIRSLDRELQTTLKCLKNYPPEKGDWKPHEKSMTARELAWLMSGGNEWGVKSVVAGALNFERFPAPPKSFSDVVGHLENAPEGMLSAVLGMSDADWNEPITIPVAPGQTADIRRADLLWFILMDHIHHRGQFSVYLRLVGGKVPSIYGPSADEPWN